MPMQIENTPIACVHLDAPRVSRLLHLLVDRLPNLLVVGEDLLQRARSQNTSQCGC